MGIAVALTEAEAEEGSEAAVSAAGASREATATAAPMGTAGPQATRHLGRAPAAGMAAATEATAVGMTLVVPGAHMMTDMAAVTEIGATGTPGGPVATWSPSGPGATVGTVTEISTGRPETTTGRGTTTAVGVTTSLGRSAATNDIATRGGYPRSPSGQTPPSSLRVSKSKSVTDSRFGRLVFLLRFQA